MIPPSFASAWEAAERRSNSPVWILYPPGVLAAIAAGLMGLGGLFIPALRFIALVTIAGALVSLAAIRLAVWFLYERWLRTIGMVCSACGHVLNAHTGTYLNPHQPGLCTVCVYGGACRRVRETGRCDACGVPF